MLEPDACTSVSDLATMQDNHFAFYALQSLLCL